MGFFKKIFGGWSSAQAQQTAPQLGLPIEMLDQAPVVVRDVLIGFQAIIQGNFEDGSQYLSGQKSCGNSLVEPSGCHAYVYTEVLGQFHRARAISVLPWINLRWIERKDPVLFLLLKGAGRPAVSLPCVNIVRHYQMEMAAQRSLPEPVDGVPAPFGQLTKPESLMA